MSNKDQDLSQVTITPPVLRRSSTHQDVPLVHWSDKMNKSHGRSWSVTALSALAYHSWEANRSLAAAAIFEKLFIFPDFYFCSIGTRPDTSLRILPDTSAALPPFPSAKR